MKTAQFLFLKSSIYLSLFLVSCSPSFLASTIVSSTKMAKSAAIRNQASMLANDSVAVKNDSINYASYYIYRNGSFVGSVLSCLVYDNDEYVAVANVKTFEKVNYVMPGNHTFASKIDAKDSVQLRFEPGKTYIVQVLANSKIVDGILFKMDSVMIEKEISKGKFLSKEFTIKKLSVSDFSY